MITPDITAAPARARMMLPAALLAAFVLSAPAAGDTLVTAGGRKFVGRVVERTSTEVVFDIHQYGAVMRKTFRKAEVASLTTGPIETATAPATDSTRGEPKPPPVIAYEKPTYYPIPVKGMIGMQATASYLKRCLDDAEARKPTVVVLLFDSPGGLVSEVEPLVEVIRRRNDRLRIVAYVRKAVSAAAVTALACKEIYVEPGSVLGAATAFRINGGSLPEAVSEKFQSAWRAQARAAAQIGGHEPLLAEAMIDRSLELHLAGGADGRTRVAAGKGAKTITRRGKLLTLTAPEAVAAGLARAVSDDLDDLARKLDLAGWVECKGLAVPLADYLDRALKAYLAKADALSRRFKASLAKATAAHPDSPEAPYRYYAKTGRFTPESQQRWTRRSRQCATWLAKAEADLKEMAEYGERFEELRVYAAYFRKLEARVKKQRMEVVHNIHKRGPDD